MDILYTMFEIKPIKTYEELLEILKRSGISYDFDQIDKAYKFALEVHENQKRLNGESYIIHILAVAGYVAQLNLDNTTIVSPSFTILLRREELRSMLSTVVLELKLRLLLMV